MPRYSRVRHVIAAAVLIGLAATPVSRGAARQQNAGFDTSRLERLDAVVTDAIGRGDLPGAVVLVGRGNEVVWQRAWGDRAVEPVREAMTLDTIFDLASLTKVVATTTAVMMLVEDGAIRLNDRVTRFIPGFERHGKDRITIHDLLAHVSGLRPDVSLTDPWVGYDTAIALAIDEKPTSAPGVRFVYSDINFFVLAEIVARVSGEAFDAFATRRIFEPLGMRDTRFNPPQSAVARIAPTEACTPYGWPCEGPDMAMLRGTVHDPTARRMAGVAGHAGLFSTAADLARFARALLGGGAFDGTRILSPLTVSRMTSPATPPGLGDVRGLGWDLESRYSSNRGELLPLGSFGHTGFTGPSIWIDPATGVFVIFMSSRLHPDGEGDVVALRARVATIVASSLVDVDRVAAGNMSWPRPAFVPSPVTAAPAPARETVLTGIDVLRANGFASLAGRRVGLLTNRTGVAGDGASTIDVLSSAPGVDLRVLFSPEHGIRGDLDENVPSGVDARTGLTIHSLYGETRRPTPDMLDDIDTIVIDLQDVGVRFYTYIASMANVMEVAAGRGVRVVVLDRPNPIGGELIEGPALDDEFQGFTGYMPAMPVRHGMTIGELAKLFNGELGIGADLEVVPMRGWPRDAWFDETGLRWINPSPNMRNLYAAALYPGLGAFEHSNISVGRGTDTPFEYIGAPWIDGPGLADALNARALPGVRFYPVDFTPDSSVYAGESCHGVFIVVTDRDAVRPVRVGVELAAALERLHPDDYDPFGTVRLFGSAAGLSRIDAGDDPAAIAGTWSEAEARWRAIRAPYLIYQ